MGERAPAISVVMATRDEARYLRDAVESVLGQTERDFEFVIVDDGAPVLDGLRRVKALFR